MSKHHSFFFISIALIGILILVLLLLFIPDMSATLIDTVPELPPESTPVDNESSSSLQPIIVDKTNAKSIVAALKRPDEYFSKTESVLYHENGSSTSYRQKWVKGDLSRVDLFSGTLSAPTFHYVYTKSNVFVWRNAARSYYKTARGEFDADDAQMMMSYEDIASSKTSEITSAQLTTYDSAACIYVEMKDQASSYTKKYWISYSTGLLVFGQTFDKNGKLIYSIKTTQTDVSPQDAEIFKLPDGKMPE